VKSPWKASAPLEPDREYLVLASSIPAKTYGSTGKLFRGASAVRKQLATADGLVGYSMLASPLTKKYATLSVWRDPEALAAFIARSPHHELMGELAPVMGPTKFVRWTINGSDGLPAWNDALRRLETP
jgi:heme-degrading monooxygenase HmoA